MCEIADCAINFANAVSPSDAYGGLRQRSPFQNSANLAYPIDYV
ncbi:hypothetical protein [Nostoc sp.]